MGLLENKEASGTITSSVLNWKDSPSTQHLLDAISSIIAREFIMIAKQNPTVFSGKSEIASGTTCPRNDAFGCNFKFSELGIRSKFSERPNPF